MLEVEQELARFQKSVIKEAKANLTKLKKNASGKLHSSIRGESKKMPNSIRVFFAMEEYGFFQDQGVSGVKTKHATPYSYTSKMPPPNKLDKWIVRKGIAPRDEKGRLIPRKSLQFAIARKIFEHGIKPTKFFTKSFESAYSRLPDELIKKYGLDVQKVFDSITKENLKKI